MKTTGGRLENGEIMSKRFPLNPFEDVEPSAFNKYNKKHASEHFLDENFRKIGWEVFEPFTDTGIDRIIRKKVCPNGDTDIHDDTRKEKKCSQCNQPLQRITRFIQIKARALKVPKQRWLRDLDYRYFGYTLESKDFRTDPRHVFLFYSDNTTDTQQDVHIIPIADYFQFMIDHNQEDTRFAVKLFRTGKNKDNFIHYTPGGDWTYIQSQIIQIPFCDWLNENGLGKISDISIENDFAALQTQVTEHKLKLFYRFSKGNSRTISDQDVVDITQNFQDNQLDNDFPQRCKRQRQATRQNIQQSLATEQALRDSIEGYFIQFKELRGSLE